MTLYIAYRNNHMKKLATGGFADSWYGNVNEDPTLRQTNSGITPKVNPLDKGMDNAQKQSQDAMSKSGQGTLEPNLANLAGPIASVASGVIDTVDKGDPLTGRPSTGGTIGKGALKGAAAGAAFGPWGAAIGGVVGAATGWLSAGKMKQEAMRRLNTNARNQQIADMNRSNAMITTNPELVTGWKNSGYYALGGDMNPRSVTDNPDQEMKKAPLSEMYIVGGKAKSLSSSNTIMEGKDHGEGGIHLPALKTEVEDGETTNGTYVFSKKLGFAGQHKPIAKAKGIIEKKPMTAERVNTMKRLANRENELMQQQELVKQYLQTA